VLHEAELFVSAEVMLVEVLGRIRPQDEAIVLPPMSPRSPRPVTVGQAVAEHVLADLALPSQLAGQAQLAGRARAGDVATAARQACDAAAAVVDGDRVLPTDEGEVTARDVLLRATLQRSLLAHYVAAHLGSTACPLPEELARPLWELTAPDAESWRALGWFRAPMPLPPHVSWRDRFLLTAGHEPHPLGH
jgi:hypothetical protein